MELRLDKLPGVSFIPAAQPYESLRRNRLENRNLGPLELKGKDNGKNGESKAVYGSTNRHNC
jgi:hypothetical protein